MLEQVAFNVLLGLGAGLLWTRSEPAIYLRRALGFREEEYDSMNPFKRFLHRGLECLPCTSFWLTGMLSIDPVGFWYGFQWIDWHAMLIVLIPAYIMDRWS